MGEGRHSLPPRFGQGRMRGTVSLDAEEAQPPPDRHPGRRPLPVTAQRHLPETGRPLMAPLFAVWDPAYLVRLALVPTGIGRLILARSGRYAP